jgi:hypothetical protein
MIILTPLTLSHCCGSIRYLIPGALIDRYPSMLTMRIIVALALSTCQVSLAFLSTAPPYTRHHLGTNLHILAVKDDSATHSKRFLHWVKSRGRSAATTKTPIQEVIEETKPERKFRIQTIPELDDYFEDTSQRFRSSNGEVDYDELLKCLEVHGDTQIIGSKEHPDRTHPVVQLLHERKRVNSTCFQEPRQDGCRVALAIEGGGMRGCVSAGMVAARYY